MRVSKHLMKTLEEAVQEQEAARQKGAVRRNRTDSALQSGALLESTGLTAGDAFSELGDLLLDGLSAGQGAPG